MNEKIQELIELCEKENINISKELIIKLENIAKSDINIINLLLRLITEKKMNLLVDIFEIMIMHQNIYDCVEAIKMFKNSNWDEMIFDILTTQYAVSRGLSINGAKILLENKDINDYKKRLIHLILTNKNAIYYRISLRGARLLIDVEDESLLQQLYRTLTNQLALQKGVALSGATLLKDCNNDIIRLYIYELLNNQTALKNEVALLGARLLSQFEGKNLDTIESYVAKNSNLTEVGITDPKSENTEKNSELIYAQAIYYFLTEKTFIDKSLAIRCANLALEAKTSADIYFMRTILGNKTAIETKIASDLISVIDENAASKSIVDNENANALYFRFCYYYMALSQIIEDNSLFDDVELNVFKGLENVHLIKLQEKMDSLIQELMEKLELQNSSITPTTNDSNLTRKKPE